MEASGTPTPAGAPAQPPPPPPPPAASADQKPSGGWRALVVLLAVALAFASAVMVIAMSDIGSTPTCEDVLTGQAALPSDHECFDGSSTKKTISLILGWPSGVLAGLAALLAIYFAATGLRGRLVLQMTGAAVVLGALSIIVGSI